MNFDTFFYYGEFGSDNLEAENAWDIEIGVVQTKKKLYYFRQEGCAITEYENYPNALSMAINLKYTTATWFAFRNSYVSDGRNNLPDRRVAVSQNTINVEQSLNNGECDISIYYIPFQDYNNPKTVSVPVGVLK